MDKQSVKEKLRNKIIAVIRCEDAAKAKLISKTIIECGIDVLEVTFTVKGAPQLIKELKAENPNVVVGAGTVLTTQQAEEALISGADFIVSPCTIEEIGAFCREKNIFCSMAAATSTEAYNSHKFGSDVVKLFPGEFISPGIIKGIKAPMPFIDMMPTGGVDNKNIKTWFENGAFAVGVGGHLTKGIDETNLDVLRARCEALINAAK
ncbi:bifunctional 4-hydroxy-2-oxoglutarate aldolase/2-dehydro-3-deoxy-phosphogluconate aldolase [Candidatus Clostridium radicumherbarum]|uniref:Bifunctional 4-hydroxy-2-oxoglutarate aldolase/2-dehydro-3-deoxy-phosphogluconate aldolase n=1 Tax=Candidatus Clostridium radicumherbarum TaxID=3381662 RepID=A0ABW8TMU9_9CLOT